MGGWNSFLMGVGSLLAKAPVVTRGWKGKCMGNALCEELGAGSEFLVKDLSDGDHLAALHAFKKRVAFAPLLNDGTVPYATCAFTTIDRTVPTQKGVTPPCVNDDLTVIGESHHVGSAGDDPDAWVGGQAQDGTGTKLTELQTAQKDRALKLLRIGDGWQIINVCLPHKLLATLYPGKKDNKEERNLPSFEVSHRLLRIVLGEEQETLTLERRPALTSEPTSESSATTLDLVKPATTPTEQA